MRMRALAPGKLILLGEYAVLRGAPALVTAVSREAEVTVESRSGESSLLSAPEIHIQQLAFQMNPAGWLQFVEPQDPQQLQKLLFVKAAIEEAHRIRRQYEMNWEPLSITIRSSAFYEKGKKLGLGSSAAVTVALLSALLSSLESQGFGETDRFQLILEASFRAHQRAQGQVGSGVDITCSLFGGTLIYRMPTLPGAMPAEITPVDWPANLHLLPVWTGQPAATVELVQQVEAFRQRHPQEHARIFSELIFLAETGCQAWMQGKTDEFLKIIPSCYELFVKLSQASGAPIVSEWHQAIARLVFKAGAVYKHSGAGKGDLGLIFSDDPEKLNYLHKQIARAGFTPLPLSFSCPGARWEIMHEGEN